MDKKIMRKILLIYHTVLCVYWGLMNVFVFS